MRVAWGDRCRGVPVPAAAGLCGCRESAHVVRERSLIRPRSRQAAGEPRPERAVWLVTLLVTRPLARRDHAGGGQRGILQPGPAPWWVGAWCGRGGAVVLTVTRHSVTHRGWALRGARWREQARVGNPRVRPRGIFSALERDKDPISQPEGTYRQRGVPDPPCPVRMWQSQCQGRGLVSHGCPTDVLQLHGPAAGAPHNTPFPFGLEVSIPAVTIPIPVPCHPVTQWWHGLVVARGARAPAPTSRGQGAVSPRAALGTPGFLPPSVPAQLRDTAVPPLCATTTGCTTTVCHDLCAMAVAMCHDCLVAAALPGDSPSTIRPCPAPAQAALCLADTKGLRGEGGVGRGVRAASFRHEGLGKLCPSPRSSPGVLLSPAHLAGQPLSAGGPQEELPSRKVLMWQSLARSQWSRSALQGPPPMGRPGRPPESPRRSRVASPSPAPACCRSPSADVSEDLSWGPCLCLRSPALSLGCLPAHNITCLSPAPRVCPGVSCLSPRVLCQPLGSPACPQSPIILWGLLPVSGVP